MSSSAAACQGIMPNGCLPAPRGHLFSPKLVPHTCRSIPSCQPEFSQITGQRLAEVLDERAFKPLKMTDTAFWVLKEKLPRLAQPLPVDPSAHGGRGGNAPKGEAAGVNGRPIVLTPQALLDAARSGVARIIVIGSYACCDADENSGLDLFVIDRRVPDKPAEYLKAHRVVGTISVRVEVLMFSEEEFKRRGQEREILPYWTRTEGKIAYGAAS